MKAHPATLRFTVVLAAAVVFSGPGFCQPTRAQRVPAGGIDPATGLPVGLGSGGTAINPATGLPALAPNRPVQIESATGLPLPPPGVHWPAPGADIDLLSRARQAMNQGRFEEALQGYLSYHTNARRSETNGPLATALADWVELGQRYPKAKQALLDLRESDARQFVDGLGTVPLFKELADINAALGEKDYTYALFLGLEQADAPLASDCYMVIEPALVERGEYAACARYLKNPQTRFEVARSVLEMQQGLAQDLEERRQEQARWHEENARTNGWPRPGLAVNTSSDLLRKTATDSFVRTVNQLLEILVGTGRQAEAEKLRTQALATLDDPRLQPTLSEVEARVQAVQASLRPPPVPITIRPPVAERSTVFPAELPEPSASVEHWAPAFQPGAKADVLQVFFEAKELATHNHYEEALQRYLWYHNHALEYDPEGQRGVRLSSGISCWVELGRQYPKAQEALLEIRDRDLHEFEVGRGSAALFKDIEAINRHLGHDRTTCRLFKELREHQPELAKRCYAAAEDALVKQGEYALCLAYVGDGQARFQQHRQNWEKLSQWEQHIGQVLEQGQQRMAAYAAQQGRKPPAGLPSYRPPPAADNLLVKDTCQLVEILVGAGHTADAEHICTQALALVDDPRLQSAVQEAEQKLSR